MDKFINESGICRLMILSYRLFFVCMWVYKVARIFKVPLVTLTMICDIANSLEASHGPIFSFQKCDVEMWSFQCTYTENGLYNEVEKHQQENCRNKKKLYFNEEDDLHFTMKVILFFFALHGNQPHIIVLSRLFVIALIHVWRGSLSVCVWCVCHLGVVSERLSASAGPALHFLSQDPLILTAPFLSLHALYLSPTLSRGGGKDTLTWWESMNEKY